MKKIFLLLIVLVLTACDNPFKKYEESLNLLELNLKAGDTVKAEVDDLKTIFDDTNINLNPLTLDQTSEISSSLGIIEQQLIAGNLDLLIESYTNYPEVTTQLLQKIESYKTEVNLALASYDTASVEYQNLNLAYNSALNIVKYLTDNGIK